MFDDISNNRNTGQSNTNNILFISIKSFILESGIGKVPPIPIIK